MSDTVSKDQGLSVAADRKSMLPPLCQLLKNLCYSLKCCDVHKGLMKTDVTAALGVRERKCIYSYAVLIKSYFYSVLILFY